MTYELIISIVVLVLLAAIGAILVVRGLRGGWIKALMSTGNIVLSAFLACFIARDFTTIARDYVYPVFIGITNLFGLSLEQSLADFEEIIALMPLLIGMLAAPSLFLVFFNIFRAIFGFVLSFFFKPSRKVKGEDGEKVKIKRHIPVWSRVVGAVIGVVNAVLLLTVLALPFGGYAFLVRHVSDAYFENLNTPEYTREGETPHEIVYFAVQDYVHPITDNWFIKAGYNTVGRPAFTHMTETVYKDTEFGLESEAIAATGLFGKVVDFTSSDFSKMDEQSVQDLHGIVDTLDDSVVIPEIMASLISGMCDNWASGETLLGMEKPALGELLDPSVDVLLGLLATTEGKTLVADLNTLLDVMDMLVRHEIFENLGDSDKLMDILSQNPQLISELQATFEKNEHLAPMSAEIKRLCVRAVTQTLDMENTELTGKLTDSINSYKDQPEKLSQELGVIVQDYLDEQGVAATVGTELTDEMAAAIGKEFEGRDDVSEEEVIDFVLNYASTQLPEGSVDIDPDDIVLPE